MDPLFLNISNDQEVTEIESLCLNCENNGTTRLLLTKVPHFKEIVLSSFSCEHCGNQNNSVQVAQPLDEEGIKIQLNCTSKQDLNRQVVLTEYCTISIKEIEFEIPPCENRTILTTVEGIIDKSVSDLTQIQHLNSDVTSTLFFFLIFF